MVWIVLPSPISSARMPEGENRHATHKWNHIPANCKAEKQARSSCRAAHILWTIFVRMQLGKAASPHTIETLMIQCDQPVKANLLVLAQHALDEKRCLRRCPARKGGISLWVMQVEGTHAQCVLVRQTASQLNTR